MPYLPGPMYWNSDLTATKNFKMGARRNLQVRIAGFNFLNHVLLSFAPGDSRSLFPPIIEKLFFPRPALQNPANRE